jgi:hypothetical protein
MTLTREAILPAALIAAAIIVHGLITQPPRYQFLSVLGRGVYRGDTRTGKVSVCESSYRPDGVEVYECPVPGK